MRSSKKIVYLLIMTFLLSACGGNDDVAGASADGKIYVASGTSPVAAGDCTGITISRLNSDRTPANVAADRTIQASLQSSEGAVFANSNCTSLAIFNTKILAGTNSVTIYFKRSNAGSSTLLFSDVTDLLNIFEVVTYTVEVQ